MYMYTKCTRKGIIIKEGYDFIQAGMYMCNYKYQNVLPMSVFEKDISKISLDYLKYTLICLI